MTIPPALAADIIAKHGHTGVGVRMPAARAFGDRVEVWLPLIVKSKLNQRQHWGVRMRTARVERRAAIMAILALGATFDGPLRVTLTKVGGRRMDDDNLAGAFKNVRDGIADGIGRDDGCKSIKWVYDQRPRRRGEQAGCGVVIERGDGP